MIFIVRLGIIVLFWITAMGICDQVDLSTWTGFCLIACAIILGAACGDVFVIEYRQRKDAREKR